MSIQSSYKVVFLGDTGVGKSSIIVKFTHDEFYEFIEPTIGAAFSTKIVDTPTGCVNFEIWDTAGQERYRSLAPLYYRGGKLIFVVYDITQTESFNRAKKWVEIVKNEGDENAIIVLLGNKKDQEEHDRNEAYIRDFLGPNSTIPELEEQDRNTCEIEISEAEVLEALKEMKETIAA